jgi:hypothetical protein
MTTHDPAADPASALRHLESQRRVDELRQVIQREDAERHPDAQCKPTRRQIRAAIERGEPMVLIQPRPERLLDVALSRVADLEQRLTEACTDTPFAWYEDLAGVWTFGCGYNVAVARPDGQWVVWYPGDEGGDAEGERGQAASLPEAKLAAECSVRCHGILRVCYLGMQEAKRAAEGRVSEIEQQLAAATSATRVPCRTQLPEERASITHKFEVAGHTGYVTVGLYPDGRPGEVFVVMGKEGATLRGFCDAWSRAISLLLQYGVPLEDLVRKFSGFSFEPAGHSTEPRIGHAKSIIDYLSRWLALRFGVEMEGAATVDEQQQALPGGST